MKNILFIITAVVSLAVSIETGYGRRSPYVDLGKPVRNPTSPHSSMSAGRLYRNPATGSYGWKGTLTTPDSPTGDRYFRGVLPYNTTSEIDVTYRGGDIHSFLRRSAPGYSSKYSLDRSRTYYSPFQPATPFRPEGIGRSAPASGPAASALTLPTKTIEQVPWAVYSKFRPLSRRPRAMNEILSRRIEEFEAVTDLTEQTQLRRLEKIQQDLKETDERAKKVEEQLVDTSLQPLQLIQPEKSITQRKPPQPYEKPERQPPEDVYRQMQEQIQQHLQEAQKQARAGEEPSEQDEDERADESADEKEVPSYGLESRSGRTMLILYKTFAGLKKNKFNQYMKLAEDYMQAGKFYLAADAYTLASIYEPLNPLAYAGRAHALFAAGEYMSSGYFLAKAIEIFPEYTRFKVDLVAMVGDIDKLESRIVDILQWHEISAAGELEFLLAYIYYQTGKLDKAAEFINSASEKMPDAAAVTVLKQAITDAAAGTQ